MQVIPGVGNLHRAVERRMSQRNALAGCGIRYDRLIQGLPQQRFGLGGLHRIDAAVGLEPERQRIRRHRPVAGIELAE